MVTFVRCRQFLPPICLPSNCACIKYSVVWPTFILKASVIVISNQTIFSLIRKRACSRYAISGGESFKLGHRITQWFLLLLLLFLVKCQTFTAWRFSRFLHLCTILSSSRAAFRRHRLQRKDRFVKLKIPLIVCNKIVFNLWSADLWSTGVVFSELLLGQPIFYEQSGLDQLVCIISKLGTPTKEQILAMNPKYARYQFPQVYPRSWPLLFPCAPTDALDLISKLFAYDPSHRIAPLHACAHQFFDELRDPNKKWSSNRDLPPLFDFSQHELSIDSRINSRLPSYKTKPNANIAYLQQTTQQLATRMFPSSLPASSAIHLGPYPMATHFSSQQQQQQQQQPLVTTMDSEQISPWFYIIHIHILNSTNLSRINASIHTHWMLYIKPCGWSLLIG